ncbi:MAG: dTDP-4-dehydrorhamnose 3,5-epimerase [Candidatus Omnitrophota bacterium]|jgi:dTDP-4-dehydrorhamnose 3,5-epimerase
MNCVELAIPEVKLIEPRVFSDPRGYFVETYRRDTFARHGILEEFRQDNRSFSGLGVVRGLHYQLPPSAQSKLVSVLRGSIFDVAVDIRRGAPSFGRHVGIVLRAADKKVIYVPAGFAHGFLALEEGTEVLYKVSTPYAPESERGILWNDPALGIAWPVAPGIEPRLSDKDRLYPGLKNAEIFS